MYEDYIKSLNSFRKKIEEMNNYLGIDKKYAELSELENAATSSNFWDNKNTAQDNFSAIRKIKKVLEPYEQVVRGLEDLEVILEIADSGDSDALKEAKNEINQIAIRINQIEMTNLLGDEFDFNNAYLTLHAGAGGTESCDWADMLYRMFTRYCEKEGFKLSILDYQPGEEAGIKSITLMVKGDYAYGLLKSERGVHRLVRISPFDSQSRRHTSFSAADISPELNDEIEVEMNESDLRIDTFRAQGAGGQHVNTTDSAVRIVHLPTGTVVQCQAERSQHKNKATALNMLKARLYEIEKDKKRKAVDQLYSAKGDISWGSQIRSYVMQPYTMVKDHRTNEQSGNVQEVLDGNLKPFVYAFLKNNNL